MKHLLRAAHALVAALVLVLVLPSTAAARDGDIGSDASPRASKCFGGVSLCTFLARGTGAGRAPANGTLTSFTFRHSVAVPAGTTARLLVFNDPPGSSAEPVLVRRTAPLAVPPNPGAGSATVDLSGSPLAISRDQTIGITLSTTSGQGVPNLVTNANTINDFSLVCMNEPSTNVGYDCNTVEETVTSVALTAFFFSDIRPPAVTTDEASGIGPFAATLEATVNPNGAPTTGFFEMGTTPGNLSFKTATRNNGGGSTPVEVTQSITGLDPETTYYFRYQATNETDTSFGATRSFTTGPAPPPAVTTNDQPTATSGTSAVVGGTVNAWAKSTLAYVEYGPVGGAFTGRTADVQFTGRTPQAFSAELTGLQPDTEYQWRIVTEREGSRSTLGDTKAFRTRKPPAVEGLGPVEPGEDAITLRGRVTGFGSQTTWRFEYGATPGYGSASADGLVGSATGDAPQDVAVRLTGLQPDTEYHWRLVASSAGGAAQTVDGTFRTARGKAPELRDFKVLEEGSRQVKVGFDINPNGYASTFEVEYGTSTAYGTRGPRSAETPAIRGFAGAFQTLADLPPGSEVHYRIIARNRWGTTVGPDVTVRTLSLPEVTADASCRDQTADFANFTGTVDPKGLPTSVEVEFGTSNAYGSRSTPVDVGSGSGAAPVSVRFAGLAPGTRYHWRFRVTSKAGTVVSDDRSCVTLPAYAPPPLFSLVVTTFDSWVRVVQAPVLQVVTAGDSFTVLFRRAFRDGRLSRAEQRALRRSVTTYEARIAKALRALERTATIDELAAEVKAEVARLKEARSALKALKSTLKKPSRSKLRAALRKVSKATARKSKLKRAVDAQGKRLKGRGVFDKKKAPAIGLGSPQGRALVGTWNGVTVAGSLVLKPDGTYTSPNGGSGTWRPTADGVQFTGAVTFNGGRATVKDGMMEFYWRNKDGSINYFAYAKE